jgi:hypothetical protein
MTGKWSDLVAELDRWGETGHVASLWWRDDDAVAPTPELTALLQVAGAAPVALAVIPAEVSRELPGFLDNAPQLAVLQHGWRHTNHAAAHAAGAKKSEFPAGRAEAAVVEELAAGRARLKTLFGARALPVLVPPWNRFAAEFVPLLTKTGIRGLSSMASRRAAALPPDIVSMDVHLDLVAWKDDRRFIGTAAALTGLIGHLQARRLGQVVRSAVTGILTHHLVMDRAGTGFLDRLAATIERHSAARWANAAEPLAA